MAETGATATEAARRQSEAGQPAVGLVATHENGNAIAGAILRAREQGHDVLVTARSPTVEGLRFAEHLDARVIEPDQLGEMPASQYEPWSRLKRVAKKAGYPGLLQHESPSEAIDFTSSRERLLAAEEYVIDPEIRPRVAEELEVLVAIPAYNEARTIGSVVESAMRHADDVVVVDDGSSDETVENAQAAGATVIEHGTNKGYGGALKTAFVEAQRAGAAHLVILDGDGQHDPDDIPALIEHQLENDSEIVIGSRFEEGSETELPLYRSIGLRVVNSLTNLSLGVVRKRSRIADTQSGFRAYNRDAIASLATDEGIGNHMGASTDILYHAHQQGYDVSEMGTTIDYQVEDASSQNPLSHGLQLVNNILRTVERERPVTVLGVPGFVSAVIGLGFGYATFSNYISTGVFPLGLALVSVFFTLAGIFAAFTAIILHSLETRAR